MKIHAIIHEPLDDTRFIKLTNVEIELDDESIKYLAIALFTAKIKEVFGERYSSLIERLSKIEMISLF